MVQIIQTCPNDFWQAGLPAEIGQAGQTGVLGLSESIFR